MGRQIRQLLFLSVSYTPVRRIWYLSSKTQLPEACGQDPCDIFTIRGLGSFYFACWLMSNADLCKQLIEFLHFRCLMEGLFLRLLTPARIDLCTKLYRFWHLACLSLWSLVDLCLQFYGSWHSASWKLFIILNWHSICANISIDSDILQFRDIDASSSLWYLCDR